MIIFGNPTENNDWIIGDDGNDWIYGAGGNDLLQGGGGNDLLLGNDGDDTFVPGFGVDFVYGGFLNGDSGNDTVSYALYGGAVEVNLGFGFGYLKSLGDADKDTLRGIENVRGSGYDDLLVGDAGANKIYGNGGNDLLGGQAGNDSLYGGNGDDEISGGAGADLIDGGVGEDTATYFTSNERVVVSLAGGFGLYGQAQGDTLVGIENLHGSFYGDILIGNAQANDLYGQEGDDQLYGNEGNDLLLGSEGADILNGGANDDVLVGGWGKDTMAGGTGADRFVFNPVFFGSEPALDSGKSLADADVITDFSHVQHDKIDLSAVGLGGGSVGNETDNEIDELTFTFIGTNTFSGTAGELRYARADAAGETRIMGDIDGDGSVDFRIVLTGAQDLTASDFIL